MSYSARSGSGEVRRWLHEHPVPSGPSSRSVRWKREARGLGMDAVPALLEALRIEGEETRYAALMALRELGLEAYAEGYGDRLSYLVRLSGQREPVRIAPEQPAPEQAAREQAVPSGPAAGEPTPGGSG